MKNTKPSLEDDDPYSPEYISLHDAIYGENLISLGGIVAIDNMMSGLEIRGLKALDLGFGVGGVAFYLAKKYQMIISGIEVHSWMAEYASKHAPKDLAHLLKFHTYNADGTFPFPSETFDLVYSKGVLNHVADKETLFHQVNQALKPGGLFVIADWIFPQATKEPTLPLVCETKESYQAVLIKTGFTDIEFRDDSKLFLGYANAFLKNLTSQHDFIKQKYGEHLFDIIWQQHEELIEKINQHQKFATRITAKKVFGMISNIK